MRSEGKSPIAWSALLAFLLALGLAGCSSLDSLNEFEIFGSSKKPIPGERQAVFPVGVPGIQYNAPPPQPTNSNVQVNMPPAATSPAETAPAPGTTPTRRAARTKNTADDPWGVAR